MSRVKSVKLGWLVEKNVSSSLRREQIKECKELKDESRQRIYADPDAADRTKTI